MLIEHDVARYTVASDDPIEVGLRKITDNGKRTVICVEPNGVVLGVVTDGDFRRWLLADPDATLATQASVVANRSFVSAKFGAGHQEIERLFTRSILIIPLLDELGRLVAIARPRTHELRIEERVIDESAPVFVIAEIGINHNGDLNLAKRLIEVAAKAGADCAKFQMRDMGSLYRNAGAPGDHREDLGPQYTIDLLDRFSLTPDEMFQAFDECRSAGIIPLCTPWDSASARLLVEYGIGGFKVASADLTNHELLSNLAETGRPIIMSTGMSAESEIDESVRLLRSAGSSFALLHCNSTYPAPFKDINLRYMQRLAELGDCLVGYSGHERGHHVAVAAVARGARIIEKHITLDRRLEGSDHKVSLLPDELIAMIREIRDVEAALGGTASRTISQGEMMNRVNLAKSLVARVPVRAGQQITDDDIEVRSPGRGLQPNRRPDLIGRYAMRTMEPGDFFFESDLLDAPVGPRDYSFRRRWGLPVRYHDFRALAALSNPDFIEFHMSYRDLELPIEQMVPEPMPHGLVVHSPDLFPGDHLLNLASDDDSYWKRSIDELQRVIDVTRQLATRFRSDGQPTLIVASLGGFSTEAPLPSHEIPGLYARVAEALVLLDDHGVEIIPQTLPPFPWYLGGQLYCNLFVDPSDTVEFARNYQRRLCLDIAHTKLACNQRHLSFFDAVEQLAPVAAHLHVVDAAGIDGEGFQIDEGEVDFRVLAEQVDRLAPDAGFIPEIWQGHQNLGEGFWVALDRLERYF